MTSSYSDMVIGMEEMTYDGLERASLSEIRRVFRSHREQSIARHNAQLTRRAVKRQAFRSLVHDASMIGLAVTIVFGIFAFAWIFFG